MVRPVVRRRLFSPALHAFVWASASVGAVGVALASASAGCGDLKTATPGGESADGGLGSSGSSGNAPDANGGPKPTENIPPGNGPGPSGSLPSGYCCTDDAQCRDRHCASAAGGAGGARMCQDACHSDGICQSRNVMFKCSAANIGSDGWCLPAAGVTCIAQALYKRGTRQTGECCAATGDGNAGEECDGNKCIALVKNDISGPFVCSQYCELTRDCPSGTICGPEHSCEPANFPYTCK